MSRLFNTHYDHSCHKLHIDDLDAHLDVLTFTGEEGLSQPFKYMVEFTCSDHDLPIAQILGQRAHFSLHTAPHLLPKAIRGFPTPKVEALRIMHGVITVFQHLADSPDEARYCVTLQPRLARLGLGKQYRIYQHQSVPQIVESILRSRHGFLGQDFLFKLVREYPKREQVMQYGESDGDFIARLLAEVGIWYRITGDNRLEIDVVEFHDDQRHYLRPRLELDNIPLSGLGRSDDNSVWNLQTHHQVVEKNLHFRAYHYGDSKAFLTGDVDQTRGDKTTYGEAYHYAEPYRVIGDRREQDEDLESESGFFYARLRHERYLNGQTRLSGTSSRASLALAQIVEISNAPAAFKPGTVITQLNLKADRKSALQVEFQAIPYVETVCFRPPVLAKPQIAGTVPARVSNPIANDLYADIDIQGRYRVQFLFDRDEWPAGRSSLWLRLARPYAGEEHGLHLPLLADTEVAVAFEQGDPDRPYIAHALHDDKHPDHVTLARRDESRNVLRTPANNKLRMEDLRGQEHVKLSTEHSGKSQLNLGHLVDAGKKKRGEGFELRTDGWGAIRAGKGIFISADEQAKASGPQLEMAHAMDLLQQAGEQLQQLSTDAQASQADPADVQAQLNLLSQDLEQLKSAVLLLSAPKGIALTSGQHLQLAAKRNLMLNAGNEAALSVVKRLFIGVGEGLSLFVRKLGIKLIANQGPVKVQAQNDSLELMARHGLQITSTEDEIHITAKKKVVINGGGSYISLDANRIESGTAGDYLVKATNFEYRSGPASQTPAMPLSPQLTAHEINPKDSTVFSG